MPPFEISSKSKDGGACIKPALLMLSFPGFKPRCLYKILSRKGVLSRKGKSP